MRRDLKPLPRPRHRRSQTAAHPRIAAGLRPQDPALCEPVGELSDRRPEFAHHGVRHTVRRRDSP
ncbi:hypothetical protein ACIGJO_20115 [Streptomyces sp. NPDC079020]|uniref:MmyB family transcriptional regulator n=1 Tax=Streptomyces sp. NPDC079020 TaxID=3365722 RepID=UPI0037D76D4F